MVDLLSRAAAPTSFDPPASDRVCIASTSGGLASLLADMAADRGLSLPDIEGETERRLLEMEDLLTFGEMHNPADIRGYGAEVLPEIAEILFDDDAFDAYVFAVGPPAVDEAADDIADGLLAVAEAADDPVLFLWTGRKEPADLEDPQPYERVSAPRRRCTTISGAASTRSRPWSPPGRASGGNRRPGTRSSRRSGPRRRSTSLGVAC